jgi:hypothetical protein
VWNLSELDRYSSLDAWYERIYCPVKGNQRYQFRFSLFSHFQYFLSKSGRFAIRKNNSLINNFRNSSYSPNLSVTLVGNLSGMRLVEFFNNHLVWNLSGLLSKK